MPDRRRRQNNQEIRKPPLVSHKEVKKNRPNQEYENYLKK